MNREELIQFLKENLRVGLYIDGRTVNVEILLEGEAITSDCGFLPLVFV